MCRRMLSLPLATWLVLGSTTVRPLSAEEAASLPVGLHSLPQAPGFTLLDVQPASVERPATPADFGVSLLTETKKLSVLPENYAVDIAPFWLFRGQTITYETYESKTAGWDAVKQTLSLSIATVTSELGADSLSTALGVGFRFSIIQGRIDPQFDRYAEKIADIRAKMGELGSDFHARVGRAQDRDPLSMELRRQIDQVVAVQDSLVDQLEASSMPGEARQRMEEYLQESTNAQLGAIEKQLASRSGEIAAGMESEIRKERAEDIADLRAVASNLTVRRVGPKVEIAGGWVSEFPQRRFDDGRWRKTGLWMNLANEGATWSWLGVGRWIDDRRDDREDRWEVGTRLIANAARGFSGSGELVYRGYTDRPDESSSWRAAMILEYATGESRVVSLALGRDFEGQEANSLLATLSLGFGFGTERPFKE